MQPVREQFSTPRGHPVGMWVRPDTNDHNVCYSCLNEDEYRTRDLHLEGVALDVGAHIGAVSVGLLVDNPALRVIALEPLAANTALLAVNAEDNGVGARLSVLVGAAGKGTQIVAWDWSGSESAVTHRYIGNTYFGTDVPHRTKSVPGYTLAQLVRRAGGSVSFLKIDCEGCEEAFLNVPARRKVQRLAGEFHRGGSIELRFE